MFGLSGDWHAHARRSVWPHGPMKIISDAAVDRKIPVRRDDGQPAMSHGNRT